MGLADKLADIIRPRPAGLFSGLAPATTSGPSAASILSGAASEIAREGVRAFMRALVVATDPAVTSRVAEADHADGDMYDRLRAKVEARGHKYLGLSADGVPTYQLQGKLQSVMVHLNIPADDTPPTPTPTPIQSPVKVTWGGVPLRGFADDEYFSIDPAVVRESMSTIFEWRDEQLPTPEQARADREMHDVIRKVFHEKLSAEVAEVVKGIHEAAAPIVY
jgi:hypothetical protein